MFGNEKVPSEARLVSARKSFISFRRRTWGWCGAVHTYAWLLVLDGGDWGSGGGVWGGEGGGRECWEYCLGVVLGGETCIRNLAWGRCLDIALGVVFREPCLEVLLEGLASLSCVTV